MNRRPMPGALMACLIAVPVARAQSYPTGPIHVIVGYSAGGAVDIVARAVSQQLQRRLGQGILP